MSIADLKLYDNSKAVIFKSRQDGVAQIIEKPINKVEDIVNNTVDKFIPEQKDEEKKKSHKRAVRVGSTVLVLGALVAILNLQFSSKLINKIKEAAVRTAHKAKNKDTFTGKLYQKASSFLEKFAKLLSFTNNYNSIKDSYFKKWCTKKTTSNNRFVKKADGIFVGVMKKPHEFITRMFDSISKKTVFKKYSKARSSLDMLDSTIDLYKSKLSPQEQLKLVRLVDKVKTNNKYFSEVNIKSRLKEQENLMSNIDEKTMQKIREYFGGLWNGPNRKNIIEDNMNFWAQEILMPTRNLIEENGRKAVGSVFGKGIEQKGVYNEIFELLSPKLNQDEKSLLQSIMNNAEKKLKKANYCECIDYFNKKRDLMLGSAPTDIVTVIAGLSASGYAISTADSKEDKYSRSLTVAFPAIAGIGVMTIMAARLFSGVKGMLIGFASSGLLSLLGSKLDKTFIHNQTQNLIKENNNV